MDGLSRLRSALGVTGPLPQFEALPETSATDFAANRYRIVAVQQQARF